jgi:hypothetical protein
MQAELSIDCGSTFATEMTLLFQARSKQGSIEVDM